MEADGHGEMHGGTMWRRRLAVDAFLDEHFARHSTLQRHELQEHFNLSKRNALRLMELLVATKRLMPKGEEHVRRYVRGEALRVEG